MKKRMAVFVAVYFITLMLGYAAEQECQVTGSATSTQYLNATINLKILVVEFSNIKCKKISGSDPKYTKANYEEMFGSDGIYVSSNKYTPDGDVVYGSMNDYFRKMSSGNIVINATLLNNVDANSKPIWITLSNTKQYYHSTSIFSQVLISDALTAAIANGISIGTLDDYNKLVIIYAGNRYNGGGLNPYANYLGGTTYIMSELENSPMGQENGTDKFARIGTHCHEFAHTLGIKHSSGSRADIMQAGNRNGNWAAPAPLNPIARMAKGWLTPTTISGHQQYDLNYSLVAPQVFRVNSDANSDYFLVENRRFNQTMTIGSYTISDYNNSDFMPIAHSQNSTNVIYDQGILVWRVRGYFPNGDYDDNGLVYASGRYGHSYPDNNLTETDAGVIFPGTAGVKILSPWSDSRNPYGSYDDPFFGSVYNLFVPTTNAGINVGLEILSENAAGGYFTVRLHSAQNVLSTPISSNTTLDGEYFCNSNVTINSGVTVNINSGSTIVFQSGSSLYSNGTLNVNGTSSDPIIFTSQKGNNENSWGSIYLNGSDATNSQINYCNVSYGYGIGCYDGANITIDHCVLQNNTYGVICENSSPIISNNIIHNVTVHGVQSAWNANPRIESNTITNDAVSSGYGVYVYSASGYINSNTISGFTVGVYPRTYSNLGGWSGINYNSTPSQNNVIIGNTYGIDTWDNTNAFLGYHDSYTGLIHGGNNYIQNNSGYDLVANNYTNLFGEGNWYGTDYTPTTAQGAYSAYLPWSPLYTNPFPFRLLATNQKQPTSLSKTTSVQISNSTAILPDENFDDEDKLFQDAISDHLNKLYNSAQNKYTQLLSSSKYSQSTLVLLSHLFMESNDDNVVENFEEIASNPSKNALDIKNLSLTSNLLANMYGFKGNYDKALVLYDNVINNYPNTTEERNARVQKIYYSVVGKKDQDGAKQMLNDLLAIYKDGDDIDMIKNLVDHTVESSTEKTKQLSKESKIVKAPIEYSLSQNYPNPFNPTTTITFSIPQAGNVTLNVFDALGREIVILVNGYRSEGKYNVEFNGSSLSSGVYFYRLQSGNYVATKKLVLMK